MLEISLFDCIPCCKALALYLFSILFDAGSETLIKTGNDTPVHGNYTPLTSNQSKVATADKVSDNKNIPTYNGQIIGAYIVIVPFAISSIQAIRAHFVNNHDAIKYQGRIKWSLMFMILGLYLLISVIALIILLMLTHS